jgi:hypothetical protein
VAADIDLRSWLFAFGGGIRIESPDVLRQELVDRCREAMEANGLFHAGQSTELANAGAWPAGSRPARRGGAAEAVLAAPRGLIASKGYLTRQEQHLKPNEETVRQK